MAERLSVLCISSSAEGGDSLLRDLRRLNAEIISANNCEEARRALAAGDPIRLVVTSASLDDGNWYSVLADVVQRGTGAELVVVAKRVNESFRRTVQGLGAVDAVAVDSVAKIGDLLARSPHGAS